MNSYFDRVAQTLSAFSDLSVEEALKQWEATGEVIDYVFPIEQCELCQHPGLRWHFEIEHNETSDTLWVGSVCILRFRDILVRSKSGDLLEKDNEREKRLNEYVADLKYESCKNTLLSIDAQINGRWNWIKEALRFWCEKKYLSPALFVCVSEYVKNRPEVCEHPVSYFKVGLRRHAHQRQLLRMSAPDKKLLWAALSVEQRRKYSEEQLPLKKPLTQKQRAIRDRMRRVKQKQHRSKT